MNEKLMLYPARQGFPSLSAQEDRMKPYNLECVSSSAVYILEPNVIMRGDRYNANTIKSGYDLLTF